MPLSKEKKKKKEAPAKTRHRSRLTDASGPAVDSTVHGQFIRNDRQEDGCQKSFLRKGSSEKRLKYDKLNKHELKMSTGSNRHQYVWRSGEKYNIESAF